MHKIAISGCAEIYPESVIITALSSANLEFKRHASASLYSWKRYFSRV